MGEIIDYFFFEKEISFLQSQHIFSFLLHTLNARTVKATEHEVRSNNSCHYRKLMLRRPSSRRPRSHRKARECRTDGPSDFSEERGRHTVVVFPGDFRLNLPSTEQQGACCQVTAVSSASRSLRGSRMVSLMRKQSNETTDTWEILITKFL